MSTLDTSAILKRVDVLAREAGEELLRGKQKGFAIQRKSGSEVVTSCDVATEKFIVAELSRMYPDSQIVGEEGEGSQTIAVDHDQLTWYVDPIDGTANFAHGMPWYAVSIAAAQAGQCVVGVVHVPEMRWTFGAARGAGAFFNGQPMRVSPTAQLSDAIVATGFSYDRKFNVGFPVNSLREVLRDAKDVRRMGAAAIDCAMVAAGWLEGYWETGIKAWDVAAGIVLVAEAGGKISNYRGEPYQLGDANFLVSNGGVHAELVAALQRAQ